MNIKHSTMYNQDFNLQDLSQAIQISQSLVKDSKNGLSNLNYSNKILQIYFTTASLKIVNLDNKVLFYEKHKNIIMECQKGKHFKSNYKSYQIKIRKLSELLQNSIEQEFSLESDYQLCIPLSSGCNLGAIFEDSICYFNIKTQKITKYKTILQKKYCHPIKGIIDNRNTRVICFQHFLMDPNQYLLRICYLPKSFIFRIQISFNFRINEIVLKDTNYLIVSTNLIQGQVNYLKVYNTKTTKLICKIRYSNSWHQNKIQLYQDLVIYKCGIYSEQAGILSLTTREQIILKPGFSTYLMPQVLLRIVSENEMQSYSYNKIKKYYFD